ncbi:ComEA family DNA-binding protein [Brevibacillus dissolubilis]|uniref:ComEA family DNA-binding protein n=1 Tax=Brevibacillus dissolubilis TaxID=1844116 RepID=UPI0011160C1E|nr:helix-hairpin-helix domain-containing protein [Brevibacillus dissolubilis]
MPLLHTLMQFCPPFQANGFDADPHIPDQKVQAAREHFPIPLHEFVVALIDASKTGNGKTGFAVCESGVYWRNGSFSGYLPWEQYATVQIRQRSRRPTDIRLGQHHQCTIAGSSYPADRFLNFLGTLQMCVRGYYAVKEGKDPGFDPTRPPGSPAYQPPLTPPPTREGQAAGESPMPTGPSCSESAPSTYSEPTPPTYSESDHSYSSSTSLFDHYRPGQPVTDHIEGKASTSKPKSEVVPLAEQSGSLFSSYTGAGKKKEEEPAAPLTGESLFSSYMKGAPSDASLKPDLNNAALERLLDIPGITTKRAAIIIEERSKRRGFRSFAELGELLQLSYQELAELQEEAVILPYVLRD